MDCPFELVMKIESCATGTYEPCQGRKAAALSKHSCVPQGSFIGANKKGNAWKAISNIDARNLYKKNKSEVSLFFYGKDKIFNYLKDIVFIFHIVLPNYFKSTLFRHSHFYII